MVTKHKISRANRMPCHQPVSIRVMGSIMGEQTFETINVSANGILVRTRQKYQRIPKLFDAIDNKKGHRADTGFLSKKEHTFEEGDLVEVLFELNNKLFYLMGKVVREENHSLAIVLLHDYNSENFKKSYFCWMKEMVEKKDIFLEEEALIKNILFF